MKMKKKKIIIISAIILAFLLVAFGSMSWFIGTEVFKSSTQLVTNQETSGVKESFWKTFGIDYEKFKSTYKIEGISVPSSEGDHDIPGDYIYAKGADTKDRDTVILIHGLGGNRYSNYPVAAYFLEKGYNVITYDQRSSGENKAKYTTFGYLESDDAKDLVYYASNLTTDKAIGLWGTSFGGATAGHAISDKDIAAKVKFAVLDCPVSSMKDMVAAKIDKMDIPLPTEYMTWCGSVVNKFKLGFSYGDADVPSAVADTDVPVLVINSKADQLTPYYMGRDIYKAIDSKDKKILSVKDSDHAQVWLNHRELYRKTMDEFISQY